METLTLPEPASQLWAAKRAIIHSVPPEMFRSVMRPHIGGGTILAARWRHRLSTDIDVLLPGRNSLIDVLQNNDDNIVTRLGGTPEAVGGGRVKIAFEHGRIDLATFTPDPPDGQREALVDGHRELVLSSAQILRGKLERVDQMLVRDVFDVVTASGADPAALATAASMMSKQRAAAIEAAWRAAGVTLARDFDDEIHGADRTDGGSLGKEAAAALHDHRYTRIEVNLDGRALTIRKTVATGPLPVERYDRDDPARALIESGVAPHLNNNGPVSAPQLLGAIRLAMDADDRDRTLFDTTDRESTKVVDRTPHVGEERRSPEPPVRPRTINRGGYDR